jgi:hypothetical protein
VIETLGREINQPGSADTTAEFETYPLRRQHEMRLRGFEFPLRCLFGPRVIVC